MSKELIGALIGLGGALFGVLVAAGISIWTFRQSQVAKSADEFRAVLQDLVDLRIQTNAIGREHASDSGTREFLNGVLNVKRQLHKSTAARILIRARGELSAHDYETLAFEYQTDSEFEKALECYEYALENARGPTLERVAVLRSLGGLLLKQAPLHDRTRAEGFFREASELTADRRDDYSKFTTGFTHELLGNGLLAYGYPEWKQAMESARQCYEAMSPDDYLRQSSIERLNFRAGQADVAVPGSPATSPPSPANVAAL